MLLTPRGVRCVVDSAGMSSEWQLEHDLHPWEVMAQHESSFTCAYTGELMPVQRANEIMEDGCKLGGALTEGTRVCMEVMSMGEGQRGSSSSLQTC